MKREEKIKMIAAFINDNCLTRDNHLRSLYLAEKILALLGVK